MTEPTHSGHSTDNSPAENNHTLDIQPQPRLARRGFLSGVLASGAAAAARQHHLSPIRRKQQHLPNLRSCRPRPKGLWPKPVYLLIWGMALACQAQTSWSM